MKLEAALPISLPRGTPLAVPSVFASHMVVPADVDFTIWGLAAVGTGPVKVTMNGQSVSAELEGYKTTFNAPRHQSAQDKRE